VEQTRALKMRDLGTNISQEVIPDNFLRVSFDASTGWGIGIVIGNEFCAFKWSED
jgi:hypothetical protein